MGNLNFIPKERLPKELVVKLDDITAELVRGNFRLANRLISLAIDAGVSRDLIDQAKAEANKLAKQRLLQAAIRR